MLGHFPLILRIAVCAVAIGTILGAATVFALVPMRRVEESSSASATSAQMPEFISSRTSARSCTDTSWPFFDSGCFWTKPLRYRHSRVLAASKAKAAAAQREPQPVAQVEKPEESGEATPSASNASTKRRQKIARHDEPRKHRRAREFEPRSAYANAAWWNAQTFAAYPASTQFAGRSMP